MSLLASFKKRFTELLGVGSFQQRDLALPQTRDIGALAGAANSTVMFLLHASPYRSGCGGTEIFVLDCVRDLKLPRAILVYPSAPSLVTVAEITNGNVDAPVFYALRLQRPLTWYSVANSEAENQLVSIARQSGAGAIVIEHLHMWPLNVPNAFFRAGLPYVFVAHDYFSVCPSLNLVNANTLRPCSVHYGGANDSARCLQSTFAAQQTTPPCDVQDLLKQHQSTFTEILARAEAVVFPSESTRKRVLANLRLDAAKTRVIPHGYPQPQQLPPAAPPSSDVLRLSLAGMVGVPIKGSDLIIELLAAMKTQPVEWHFFGVVDANNFRQRLDATGARLVIHGPYERAALIPNLRAAGIDVALFMSIAEETFSYTLSEAWCAGIPALVPRWGALGERVEQSGFGWAVEPHSASAAAAKLTELLQAREQIAALKEKLKSFRHFSLEENAAAYRAILEPLLKRAPKQSPPAPPPDSEAEVPNSEKWRAAFAASEQKVFTLDVRRNELLGALSHAAVSSAPEGIRIVSSGHDPALTLPEFAFARAFHILRLEISAPGDDVLQLFYAMSQTPGYAENRSMKALLYKGRNELYLLLNIPGIAGPLRLDPGTCVGEFVLHSLEVRAI